MESTSAQSAGHWTPYQCPSCFTLFRVQRERIGQVGECPGCQSRVRIPEHDELVENQAAQAHSSSSQQQPFVAKKAEQMVAAEDGKEKEVGWLDPDRRKRRYMGGNANKLDWEDGSGTEKKGISWMVILSVVTLVVLLLAGGGYLMKNQPKAKPSSRPVIVGTQEDLDAIDASLALTENKELTEIEQSATDLVEKFEEFDLSVVRSVTKSFLEAKTVEERSHFVRDPDRVLPLMKKFYQTRVYEAEGFRALEEQKLSYRKTYISTLVRTGDFSMKPIALEKKDEVYLVDWESWVGHCSMPIEEMIEKKPNAPVEIRTYIRPQDYYNYGFKDDKKWISFRLTFESSDRALWGYLKRKSELHEEMRKTPSRPMILMVSFPENARSSDQVEIVERVTNGWVKEIKIEEDE